MLKNSKKFRSVFLSMILIFSIIIQSSYSTTALADEKLIYLDSSKPVEDRVKDLLSRMSLAQKIGQMTQVERATATPDDVKKYCLGSVLSGGGSAPASNTVKGWADMVDSYQNAALSTELKIPILYGVDAVHGHNNAYGATIFPHNIGLGAGNDPALVKKIGAATAEEMRVTGANWAFAPTIATPHDERWGRTYEGFGERSSLATKLGTAYVKGFQGKSVSKLKTGYNVVSTVKHFVGEGLTQNGVNQGNVNMDYNSPEFKNLLNNELLPPYQSAINAGARAVMISYNSIGGVKCTANQDLITNVLKTKMNFDGIVVSDWEAIAQLPGDEKTQIKTAINAGIDVAMVPNSWHNFIDDLTALVKNGDVSQARIDDAVTRILRVKFQTGIFEHPMAVRNSRAVADFGSKAHRKIARKAVSESLVLLKNNDDVVGKLKSYKNILVAGKSANDIGTQCGGWTISWQGSAGNITPGTTILQGLQAKGKANGQNITYNEHGRSGSNVDAVIVVVGEQPYAETSGDLSDLPYISTEDETTLQNAEASGKPVIVVMVSGRPMNVTKDIDNFDGFIEAWLPGTEGEGIADVLLGNSDFKGKLPISWPWYGNDLPYPDKNNPMFSYGFGLKKGENKAIPPKPAEPLPIGVNIPAKIEAEDYVAQSGLQTETASDPEETVPTKDVGWADAGDYLEYNVNVPKDEQFKVSLRVASPNGAAGGLQLLDNGNKVTSFNIPNTGGYQKWQTVTSQASLTKGFHKLRLSYTAAAININWLQFDEDGNYVAPIPQVIQTIPTGNVISNNKVKVWMSSEKDTKDNTWYYAPKDIDLKLKQEHNLGYIEPENSDVTTINIDPNEKYQTMLGIGTSMEESTVFNLARMAPEKRHEVLEKLVDPKNGIGMNLIRICIGTPDFTSRTFYTYDDLGNLKAKGLTQDPDLKYFSIKKDIDYGIVDTLKEALAINPNLKIFASPWTPPGWMKNVSSTSSAYTNNDNNIKGGTLKTEDIPLLAKYYTKFVDAYKAKGIKISAMTMQNEPELEINYPSCLVTSDQERQLSIELKKDLKASRDDTELWAFDHNFDSAEAYVKPILTDSAAASAISGVAFHDYSGDPSAMTTIHNLYPNKDMHLTERSVWGTAGADRMAQYFRNWATSYNSWVTMLDSDIKPTQWVGVPDPTMLIQDSSDYNNYWKCPEYYITGQFSKFIQRGAVRIGSNYGSSDTVTNVAFKNPDGTIATVVINQTKTAQVFKMMYNGVEIPASIPAGTVATYMWDGSINNPASVPNSVFEPTLSPTGYSITSPTDVTISCATEGATIKYTTDGSDPKSSSTAISGVSPIKVSVNPGTTVKAYAFKQGMNDSEVRTEDYNLPK